MHMEEEWEGKGASTMEPVARIRSNQKTPLIKSKVFRKIFDSHHIIFAKD